MINDLGDNEPPSEDDQDSPFGPPDRPEEPSVTPSYFTITGNAILPDLSVRYENGLPGAGLYAVYLSDLSFNELANDTDPSFSFSVEPNNAYVLTAYYYGGQAIAAVTPTVTSDIVQDITIDTEVAMNLIMATEQPDDLEPTSLSRPLDDLLADANQEVTYLNAFYDDRNNNRNADRIADAVYSLTMDQLNQGGSVSFQELDEATIRAYGGGLEGIRSLSEILSDPKPPLNPHFTFTRYNSENEMDFGMSDLDTKRWDYLGMGLFPHITTGGTAVVYCTSTGEAWDATRGVGGVYKRVLGSTEDPILLSPTNIDATWPSWSPDETKIAFMGRYTDVDLEMKYRQPYNIFVMYADGSALKQITHYTEPIYIHRNLSYIQGALNPSWSPDCLEILFTKFIVTENPDGTVTYEESLEIINADGTSQRTLIDAITQGFGQGSLETGSWSPDGNRILFCAQPADQDDTEVMVIATDLEQDDFIYYLTSNEAEDWFASWSYDGRFIIFQSDREGEKGTLWEDLMPFYVINSYTKEVVADLGDFTNAGTYAIPRFTATEAVFSAVGGVETDQYGNAIVSGSDDRYTDSHSSYNYYREIIPAANSAGIDFSCSSWW